MRLSLYQVDAFSKMAFGGNPAAICPLETWLPDETLLSIAEENNLSETAYFVPREGDYEIRWFTPTVEVELCGHATLASAHVILEKIEPGRRSVRFHSRKAGILSVEKNDDRLELDFPRRKFDKINPVKGLADAMGFEPSELFLTSSGTYLALASSEREIRECRPDFAAIERLGKCVAITARGSEVDFVSRYFAPTHGINEDPVTGSSFCYLTPFWADRLGRATLKAHQVSRRGGEVFVELAGDRVKIAGNAALYLEGFITI